MGDDDERRALQQVFGDSSDSDDGEAQRRALQQVFGDSSDSDDDEDQRRSLQQVFGDPSDIDDEPRLPSAPQGQGVTRPPRWEMVGGIKGLWLCRDFLSAKHQVSLMHAIHREGRFTEDSHNQAMRFGDLPEWATELSRCIRGAASFAEVSSEAGNELTVEDQYMEEPCPLSFDLLWREPLFDQLIINVYKPGEGICAHVDLMRFDDGIAIVSLESACVMHFTRCKQEADNTEASGGEEGPPSSIPVYLSPGSLLLISEEARYLWKHEINRKPGFQLWEGREIHQERRTSVTLRKLRKLTDQS